MHVAIPTGGVGVLLGAVLVYLVKSKAKRVAMINWIVTIISVFPAVGAFLVSCSDLPVAGINTPYPNRYNKLRKNCHFIGLASPFFFSGKV